MNRAFKVITLIMLMLACLCMAYVAGMTGHLLIAGLLLIAALGNMVLASYEY